MKYAKIEDTKQYFIEKYGAPTETKMGNFTYRTINTDLQIFERFSNALVNCAEIVGLTDIEKQLDVICEFVKTSDPVNLDVVATRMEKLGSEFARKIQFSRKPFINMMEELGKVADKKDFNPSCVINYFVSYLGIKAVSYNIKTQNNFINIYDENTVLNSCYERK